MLARELVDCDFKRVTGAILSVAPQKLFRYKSTSLRGFRYAPSRMPCPIEHFTAVTIPIDADGDTRAVGLDGTATVVDFARDFIEGCILENQGPRTWNPTDTGEDNELLFRRGDRRLVIESDGRVIPCHRATIYALEHLWFSFLTRHGRKPHEHGCCNA